MINVLIKHDRRQPLSGMKLPSLKSNKIQDMNYTENYRGINPHCS